MGAWTFVCEPIQGALLPIQRLAYAGRPEAARPVAGSIAIHRREQATLVATAFADLD
jgi:2-oxoglutarate dehydrogenase complex dehydrogenase (E1) component-like enzyme